MMIEIPLWLFILLLFPLGFCLFLLITWIIVSIFDFINEKREEKSYKEWQEYMERNKKND